MADISITVFAMAGLLALVSLLPFIADQLALPNTVLLACVGLALGIVVRFAHIFIESGPLADFLFHLREINIGAEGFLVIFLPILLFEAALLVDVRSLMEDMVPVLTLAVVAVLISTFAVGFAVFLAGGEGKVAGLTVCLLLGAILATTDPSAVITMFREIGAPRRLILLVAGESLLNDAAAIVIYTLLLGRLTGNVEPEVIPAAVEFLRSFLGGATVGYLMGRALCHLVTPLRDLPLSEISLTVAFAYLSYVVGDHYLRVSGVVAVVVTALVVASLGRTRISPATWGELELVWRQLAFWASSLIFLFAAMVVPQYLSTITLEDLWLLGVVILAALAARAGVLFGLMPVVSLLGLGQRIAPRHASVLVWGGLRGAVSLALALGVTDSPDVPGHVQHFIAVLATGYVLVTLLINGTTLRPLIRLLKLDQLSPAEQALRNRALSLSLASIRDRVEAMARNYGIGPVVTRRTMVQYHERLATIEAKMAEAPPLSDADRDYTGLIILVTREEEFYLRHFKEGIICRSIAELLAVRTGWLLEGVKSQGLAGYDEASRRVLGFSPQMVRALRIQRMLGIEGPLARRLSLRFEALVVNRAACRSLLEVTRLKLEPLLGRACADRLAASLSVRLTAVEQEVAALKSGYPNYLPVVEYRYLCGAALGMEEEEYNLMHAESLIGHDILNNLRQVLDRRREQLARPPAVDLGLHRPDLIRRVPLFAGLEEERLAEIGRVLRVRMALPGETLLRQGDRAESMFFIASGEVEVVLPERPEPVVLGTGDFFGEMALLTRQPRVADVRAVGYCQLLELTAPDFHHLMAEDELLRRHIVAVAEERLRYHYPDITSFRL